MMCRLMNASARKVTKKYYIKEYLISNSTKNPCRGYNFTHAGPQWQNAYLISAYESDNGYAYLKSEDLVQIALFNDYSLRLDFMERFTVVEYVDDGTGAFLKLVDEKLINYIDVILGVGKPYPKIYNYPKIIE